MFTKKRKKELKKELKKDLKTNNIQQQAGKSLADVSHETRKKKTLLSRLFNFNTTHGRVLILSGVLVVGMTAGYSSSNFLLSGNVSGSSVATYDGGSINSTVFYNKLKNNLSGSNMVLTTLLYETFGNVYGDKITEEEVDSAYPNYSNAKLSTIKNSGGTEKEIKSLVKQQLSLQYGLKEGMSVSDEELSEWWKTYHPNVTIKLMLLGTKEEADKAVADIQSGRQFSEVAKSYQDLTGLEGSDFKLVSTTNEWTNEQREAIYKLSDGELAVIESQALNVFGETETRFYVVKMLENVSKGEDISKWADDMTNQIKEFKVMVGLGEKTIEDDEQSLEYRNLVNKVIKDVFKKEKVRVTDAYMRRALADYLGE